MKIKNLLLSAFFIFNTVKIYSQVTEVVSVNAPYGVAISGNYLYTTADENKIYKVDYTQTNPTLIEVVTGLNGPDGIAISGNYLYISEYSGNKISKIDITVNNPTLENVITGVNNPTGLAISNNTLFIAEFGANKISKIDITESNPTITDVVTGVNLPAGLAVNQSELFIAETSYIGQSGGDKISKIYINETSPILIDVLTDVYCYGLTLNGNDLYIANSTEPKISKINITENNPSPTDVTMLDDTPLYILFHDDYLYTSTFFGDNISKFHISPLGFNSFTLDNKKSIFPNPSKDFVELSNLTKSEKYSIYNTLGNKILEGTISNNHKVEIKNLNDGLYILKLNDGNTFKFIKE